ncbi:hypothetical protein ANACOL_00422 [Anaerotruncus colihominis DSM 17241]|uniref:Uncharacterized protein n=1 Tax=Anaerotruncus colihominis DSM 17241 TaxID=445972 RepID=B0P6P4_9FIRM|nr:hypothetical protein ANACOL_00422 [Anaerotruncus colihominis DSM 17241]
MARRRKLEIARRPPCPRAGYFKRDGEKYDRYGRFSPRFRMM